MQITLVWFQDLQQLKKKKKLNRQRDTICFQEIARVLNVKLVVQMYTYSSCVSVTRAGTPAGAGMAGVGSSKHCSLTPLLIQPPVRSFGQY